MTLRDALIKANQELEAARMEPVPAKTNEIFEALDAEPVVDALARSLYLSMAEIAVRRPEMVNVIARQYLAIGIWLGRRAGELQATSKTNGQPQ
jgi:hypothetical protein